VRVAYFDAIGGAAGDMILGALIDAGLDIELLRDEIGKLGLPGVHIRVDRVTKHQISAAQFEVVVDGVEEHLHQHHHDGHGRSLAEIIALIENSGLSRRTRDRALAIFQRIGIAESKIHGVSPNQVHFHEIGAVDSIVDIVGCSVAVDLLGLDRVYCSPLPTGSGFVRTQHGLYPVPAPATLEILAAAGVPTRPSAVEAEQVTPTGAAVLATLATFQQPAMRPEHVGYGAGHANLEVPNVLRVWIGDSDDEGTERLTVLESSIDDMTPEMSAHVVQRCLEEGALDALLVPVIMKKGRPGVQVQVLCRPDLVERLRQVLIAESPTFGVRWWEVDRFAARRKHGQVETPYGRVGIKVRYGEDGVAQAFPEFEDCRRVAEAAAVPLIQVYRAALLAAGDELG
jgi:uncharacterized protein (TIGR00299 family) protein